MNPQISDKARIRRDETVVRAFGRLYDPLCGYVRKRVGNIFDVEDLVQDVFESLLSADRVVTEQNVTKYAYACAHNRVTDYLRRHACTLKAAEYFGMMSEGTCAREADADVRFHELENAEWRALGNVGEKGRMVYLMNVRAGIPVREIAERMGIGERTAENQLFRVRNQVRTEMRKVM